MTAESPKPSLSVHPHGRMVLSGAALHHLMKSVLEKGVPFRFKAKGFSMTPFIRNGDVVTVFPVRGRTLKNGDVVAFINPATAKLNVHRIIQVWEKSYSIKGDNAFVPDGLIPGHSVLGVVGKIERKGRTVSLGVGLGRRLIALLSKSNLLFSRLLKAATAFRRFFGRTGA